MHKEKFYNLLKNTETLNEQSEQELRDLILEYPYFQVALILYLKNLKKLDSANFEVILRKIAIQIPQRKKLYCFLNLKSNKDRKQEQTKLPYENNSFFHLNFDEKEVQGNSLIDKFLSSKTAIISINNTDAKLRQEIDNEFVKKSEEENDEIITETLAMIFFQQKKYDKALESFTKLSLKYPEKSVYFATRIDEIEKLKNI